MKIEEQLNKYIHVHADCIPVRGAVRSAFYDLTRNEIILFPSVYYDILEVFKQDKTGVILNDIEDPEQKQYVLEFINFLIKNELIMFLEDPSMFPPIAEDWDMPCIIQNAIIDVDDTLHDFNKIFEGLDNLGCEYIQLRSFSNKLTLKELDELLSLAYNKSIQRIELLLKYNETIAEAHYIKLMEKQLIVSEIIVHSAPKDKDVVVNFGYNDPLSHIIEKAITFTTENIRSQSHCGIINTRSFSAPSVGNFFENKLYNGCLNRKISVDHKGEIRNCPSMPKSYGNIKNTALEDALNTEGFKTVWNINKDQIKTCRDCEFRYVCTDCRAYTEKPEDLYSKPLKCGYDPHNATWSNWSINPLKEKAMLHYGIQELVAEN